MEKYRVIQFFDTFFQNSPPLDTCGDPRKGVGIHKATIPVVYLGLPGVLGGGLLLGCRRGGWISPKWEAREQVPMLRLGFLNPFPSAATDSSGFKTQPGPPRCHRN